MSDQFKELLPGQLHSAISGFLSPRIEVALKDRGVGHCMRITDLDEAVMETVCSELRRGMPDGNIFILGSHEDECRPFRITSTKLVELRNPETSGRLRSPLLVFIPASLRTSAEDSFGIATFEELTFPKLYRELIQILLQRVPSSLVGQVRGLFEFLTNEGWPFGNDMAKVRFLLTALSNGIDGETLGASLYELTLIPDFKLFGEPAVVHTRLRRNLLCVRHLMGSPASTRGRIVDLDLGERSLEQILHRFFIKWDIQEPEVWTRPVALQKEWWPISFDNWAFKEESTLGRIQLSVIEIDLPFVKNGEKDEHIIDLIGQQILVPKERQKLNVVFEVNPHPGKVQGLDHFTVQIMAQDGGPVGKSKKVKVWRPNRNKCTVDLTNLNKVEFSEGWHFIRVLPWTAEGDPVPMGSEDDADDISSKPYDSQPFFVFPGGVSIDADPPQRAIPIEKSLEHARLRLQMTALGDDRDPWSVQPTNVAWVEGARRASRQEILHVKFGREGMVQIHFSRVLKDIEQRILANPNHPSGWRMQINMNTAEPPCGIGLITPSSNTMKSFLAARADFFSHVRHGESELVIQGCALPEASDKCLAYAQSFLDLICSQMRQAETSSGSERQAHLQALKSILAVDSIHVVLTDYRGKCREAVLVAPTHPLRALWLSGWGYLGKEWIARIQSGGREHLPPVRSALLEVLQPSAFPMGVPVDDGRIFISVENLNAFWGMYAPTTEDNSRGLVSDICAALGVPEPDAAGADISGQILAEKLERYLSQHPYVRELSINVFNPGAGSAIANALVALQQKSEFSGLRYDVRLFSADSTASVFGDAFDQLVRPENIVNEAAEAFSSSSSSHLFTKLKVARHFLDAFKAAPEAYAAHVSVLLDVFPAEELSIAEKGYRPIPLFGLIQDYETAFVDDESGTYWRKAPVIGAVENPPEKEEAFDLLAKLNGHICMATAAVAVSGASFKAVPVVTLKLDVEQRELIYQVHRVSDWVFTVDRHMGIEFFDHGGLKDRPDYLIDFVSGASSLSTHNLIVSSRSTEELEVMLRPVLENHGLSATGKHAVKVLSYLRSLSGQLALKLISSPTQQAEALGLALARLYLEYQGALNNQIILPLDAHTDLYRGPGQTDEIEDAISLQRTDLALFDLDLANRTVTCNLVEVKCYFRVGDFSVFNQMKERITRQISQSERILQRHFDPGLKKPDRPDRLLKSREFAKTLQFYLERSLRYGIMESEAAHEAHQFLQSIESGYSLQFRRSAIVFDFDKQGTEPSETEVGIEFHRVGRDLIQALLDGCEAQIRSEDRLAPSYTRSLGELILPQVPKLESAAFLAPRRERTETWIPAVGDPQPAGEQEELPVSSDQARSLDFHDIDPEDGSAPLTVIRISRAEHDTNQDHIGATFNVPDVKESEIPSTPAIAPNLEREEADLPLASDSQIDSRQIAYDIMLGVSGESPQYGLIGEVAGRKVALDLNHTHTISLFGVQGGGKSYTLGTVIEMASMAIANVNVLPSSLATVIFHYSPTQDYAPEFTSMIHKNTVSEEVQLLRDRYRALPQALQDVVILTPADKVAERRAEYPDLEIYPIAFSAGELKAAHWKFLMGAIGSQSMYMRQINLIMRGLRSNLTLESIRNGIDNSGLSDHLKDLAQTRLQFASEYLSEGQRLQDIIRPGRLIIVDLRDEYIEKDEALGLFVVMLQIFSEATFNGDAFNKMVVFDEAHKYIENADLVSGLVEVVREMRHKGTSIMVASQDPPSVPISLIELSSQIIMHKFNSPAWLKHIQKANAALGELTSEKMSRLGTGEAYIWSSKASDDTFSKSAVKVKCRPRVTQHGGSTKTAVS